MTLRLDKKLIEDGWQIKKIQDVFTFKNTVSLSRELLEYNNNKEQIWYIHYGDIHTKYINFIDIKKHMKLIPKVKKEIKIPESVTYLSNGDLLVADASENYEDIGKSVEIKNITTENIISGLHTFALSANKDEIAVGFRSYILKSNLVRKQILKIATGISVLGISKSNIEKVKLILPPLKEQQKIAEILSTWDLAIEKQEQLIEKKKEFKKGLMQRLYTKGTKKEKLVKSKLGEVPESWEIIKAKEVFKSVSIKNNENEELLSVTQDKGTIPRSQLEGSVVMPEGSTRGYKLVVPNNFIISLRSFQGGLEISQHRGIISPAYTVLENKINICHDYFKYYFKKEEFISRLNGVIVGIRDGKQISYADFGEMFLPVPPIEEQSKIAEILTLADKELELLQKEFEALKLQKKGLMQRLLTGEVRVKA